MKAIVCSSYGRPDVLELAEVEKPALADDLVLVKVRAASVNPADWYGVAGPLIVRPSTGLFKPRSDRTGIDFAGTVEAVGKNVTHVSPGDDVFGARSGALAEYVTVRDAVVAKPANLTFEEAAAVPVAAITALQGPSGQGAAAGRPAGADQRRVGRRRHVRDPDREGARSGGDGGVQHRQRRAGSLARRRPRRRLHPRGLHPQRPALRPAPRRRRRQIVVAAQACADPGRHRRHRRSAEAAAGRADRPHRPAAGGVAAARQPESRVLHRQDEQGRHGDPARTARDRRR